MKKLLKAILLFSLLALIWTAKPIYEFYAHMGKAPLPFWGWHAIPRDTPIAEKIYSVQYKTAGDLALNKLEEHTKKIQSPGISAAVAIGNDLIWAGAVGWSDIENKIPVNLETRFRIGSTSKALTSILLAKLVQQGKLELDVSIANYINPLPNPKWEKITLRQLASHMSGLPHYKENTELLGLYKTVKLQTHYEQMIDAIKIFDESELLFEPGTKFSYSTLGTVLIGAIIESVEGKTFFEVMNEYVFIPRSAQNTIVAPTSAKNAPNMASAYKSNRMLGSEHKLRGWRPVDLSHRLPGGGFASTPIDLVKMGSGMLDDSFITEKTRKIFWTEQKINIGNQHGQHNQHYALGWRVPTSKINGIAEVMNANHGGVSRGSQCWLMVIPEYNMTVAVTINRKTKEFWDFGKVSMEIARYFIDAEQDIKN